MQRKTNPKPPAISTSARAPGAEKPTAAAAATAAVSSSDSRTTDVAPPELEQRVAKVSPPFASDRWAAGGASSSDDEEGVNKETKTNKSVASKPAPARKSGSKAKGKDRYLVAPSQELMPASGGAPDPFAAVEDDALPPASFDPFADEAAGAGVDGEDAYVHLRVQQRNGRKTLTTVQGLSAGYKYAKVLRDLKRELCCNGTVVEDKELGSVIQLQGDHRKRVADFLAKAGLAKPDCIKLHGF